MDCVHCFSLHYLKICGKRLGVLFLKCPHSVSFAFVNIVEKEQMYPIRQCFLCTSVCLNIHSHPSVSAGDQCQHPRTPKFMDAQVPYLNGMVFPYNLCMSSIYFKSSLDYL